MATLDDTMGPRARHLISTCQEALRGRIPENIQAVFLYGSALGSSFRSDSDIDIAVLDRPDDRLGWRDQSRLMDLLERATGRNVDLRMLRDTPLSHQINVLEQGIRLWVRNAVEAEQYGRETLKAWRQQAHPDEDEWSHALSRLAARSGSRS